MERLGFAFGNEFVAEKCRSGMLWVVVFEEAVVVAEVEKVFELGLFGEF